VFEKLRYFPIRRHILSFAYHTNRGTKFWRFSGANAPHAGKSARAPHLLSVFDIFRFGALCVQPRPSEGHPSHFERSARRML